MEQEPAARRGPSPSLSATGGRSVRVQTVLYGNDPAGIARFLDGLARTTERAKQAQAVDMVTCWLGDCSPAPCLDPRGLLAARRRHASLDRLEHCYFGENLGHGGGHNRLLAEGAVEDVTLLVNPDTYPSPWLLIELLEGLADPATAVVEARQLPFEHPKHYDPPTGVTGWASCACSLVRTTALVEVGGFDADSFFLHGDDVDLSWRIRLAGHRIRHRPSAVVFHDKALRRGIVAQSTAERVHSAEAAIMLGWKWSRPDIVEHWSRWFAASGDPAYQEAARRFQTRIEQSRLPAQLDPDGIIGEFVESHYAVHRF
jgi:GT2 family glycosyltransferase